MATLVEVLEVPGIRDRLDIVPVFVETHTIPYPGIPLHAGRVWVTAVMNSMEKFPSGM